MMGYTIESAIALLVLWSIIRLFWLLRMIITLSTPDFKFNLIKGHLLIAWPLILSYLIGGSTDYIDGVMATHFFGPTTFAVFRFGAREFPISLLLANALSISLIPLLGGSSTMQSGLRKVKLHSSRLLHVIFPLSILLIFTSKWFYPLVFDHRFADSAAIFNIYLLLAISRMVFPQSIALALKENRALLIISLVEIIINIFASYLMMMKFGIIGIAWGTVIAYSSEKLMLSAYLSFKYQLRLADYVPLLTWLSYSVLLLISYIFTTYI